MLLGVRRTFRDTTANPVIALVDSGLYLGRRGTIGRIAPGMKK